MDDASSPSRVVSVRSYQTSDGARWQVQWRDAHKKLRGRSFTSKREALAFDADVKAKKYKGEALPKPTRLTLAQAYEDWYRLRGCTLAPSTQAVYKTSWKAHVANRFDDYALVELVNEPQLFEEMMADMRERGVGPAAQRKVLVVMSAVLTAAVDWRKIPTNPLWRIHKPPATPQRHPRPFPPVVVERIRLRMRRRETKDKTGFRAIADACFVTLMSYAGLRPGEALALQWADIGSHTIAIDKAISDREERPTKTGAKRTVAMVEPLLDDLNALRRAAGRPAADAIVLPNRDGGYWSRAQLNNWRKRVWRPVLKDIVGHHSLADIASARPYDCRATFVSLHLRAGASPLEVASWAGHSPAVMFGHYSRVIEELRGEPIIPVLEQIKRARVAAERTEREQLDQLTADLVARPTVASGGVAASMLYDPSRHTGYITIGGMPGVKLSNTGREEGAPETESAPADQLSRRPETRRTS